MDVDLGDVDNPNRRVDGHVDECQQFSILLDFLVIDELSLSRAVLHCVSNN